MQVTLVATPDSLHLKNEAESGGGDDSMRTEMTLPVTDLHMYDLALPSMRGVRSAEGLDAFHLHS